LRGCSCDAAAEDVDEKCIPEATVFVEGAELAFVVVFECEVEGLCGEVSDYVD
jgi:hypothetical protein